MEVGEVAVEVVIERVLVQRLESTMGCRLEHLDNWYEALRIGADMCVEAMPDVELKHQSQNLVNLKILSGLCSGGLQTRTDHNLHLYIFPPPHYNQTTPCFHTCHCAMTFVSPPMRQLNACLRCVRRLPAANGTQRHFSSSPTVRENLQKTDPPTPAPPTPSPSPETIKTAPTTSQPVPEFMQKWGTLDPQMVENKKQERRLLRRDNVLPIGSRRRRAVLRRSTLRKATEVPFEQLPYQCFQEARKVLLEDRQEKIKKIEIQQLRIKTVTEQDPAISGGSQAKDARLRSMRKHLEQLVIQADINDPIVKKKFEDGQGKILD